MIEVKLSRFEMFMAASVGIRRHIEALSRDLPDRHGFDGASGWQVHIEGACGEVAFAKAAERYWSGSVNTFKDGGDVGDVQVRTRSRHDYDLLVRPGDPDTARFVLVTGTAPTYRVWGWIRGSVAKSPHFLRTYGDRPAAYFVPKSELHPVTAPALQEAA